MKNLLRKFANSSKINWSVNSAENYYKTLQGCTSKKMVHNAMHGFHQILQSLILTTWNEFWRNHNYFEAIPGQPQEGLLWLSMARVLNLP